MEFKVDWDRETNIRKVEGKPVVFHCHHYNCHLQKTIEDSKIVGGKEILINSAREVAYEHFTSVFSAHKELDSPSEKFKCAEKYFQTAGFGLVKFEKYSDKGGNVKCPVSHYAKGWISKWGNRKTPMCFFNTGWIAGVFEAVYDKQRYYFDVAETSCEAVKGKGCKYNVEVR